MDSISGERIKEDAVQKAVRALLKWKKLQSQAGHRINAQKNLSSEDETDDEEEAQDAEDDFIYLLLTLKKVPPQDVNIPIKVPLPHSLHPPLSLSNICLIIGDTPKNSNKGKTLSSEAIMKKLRAEDIPIAKLIRCSKLKSDYTSFQAKRDLFNSHDVFLADKRVAHLLPKILGKQFYKKKRKVPVPVELRVDRSWKEEIERALSSALLCFGSGTCSVLRVARRVMEIPEIIDNVLAAINGIAEVVPKKWSGIRGLHLKLSDSLALPIYEADASMDLEIGKNKMDTEGKAVTLTK